MSRQRTDVVSVFVIVLVMLAANPSESLARSASPYGAIALKVKNDFTSSSVMFVKNVGQWDPRAYFQIWGTRGGTTWLTKDAIWITLAADSGPLIKDQGGKWRVHPLTTSRTPVPMRTEATIRLSFVGANPQPTIDTFDQLDTSINYFVSDNPERWRTNVPAWGVVSYVDLYPGVDMKMDSELGHLAMTLSRRTNAYSGPIRLRVEGAAVASIEESKVLLASAVGIVALPLPKTDFVYEIEGTTENGQDAVWAVSPSAPGVSRTRKSSHMPSTLIYSTFLGGCNSDGVNAIAVDATGATYVTGYTYSVDFPTTTGTFDPSLNGDSDVVVAKLDPYGRALIYATVLGGEYYDAGFAIALDATGNAYVTGSTRSSDFPVSPNAVDPTFNGDTYYPDAFVAKLGPNGNNLLYSTFMGGERYDEGFAISLDSGGNTYLTGQSLSADFPTTPSAFSPTLDGHSDAFVAKLDSEGSGLVFSTFLGGSYDDAGQAIATDTAGNVYVAGATWSIDFPATSGTFDPTFNSYFDAFVTKLNPAGDGLVYSTYLGGRGTDIVHALAVDRTGSVYVVGTTSSRNFPTTPDAFDPTFNGSTVFLDSFAAKLNSTGSSLVFATFLGGTSDDWAVAITPDEMGNSYIAGTTSSSDFPTTPDAFDPAFNGGSDVFLTQLNPTGHALSYATYIGESGNEDGTAIALVNTNVAIVAGVTTSDNFPVTLDSFDPSYNGGEYGDGFLTKLRLHAPTRIFLPRVPINIAQAQARS